MYALQPNFGIEFIIILFYFTFIFLNVFSYVLVVGNNATD